MAFQTYIIGRGRGADIRLNHISVSRRHAEMTIATDGRLFLTDRDSLLGTWILRDGKWSKHRQGYLDGLERVRFGKREVSLAELIGKGPLPPKQDPSFEPHSIRPRRRPDTGEIEV